MFIEPYIRSRRLLTLLSNGDGNWARAVKPREIAGISRFPENRARLVSARQSRRSRLRTRNRNDRGVDKVGVRHKGGSGASKGMRESASNHEFNAFYHDSSDFFRAGTLFPQSLRYYRVQSGHEIDTGQFIPPHFSLSLSAYLGSTSAVAIDRVIKRDFVRKHRNHLASMDLTPTDSRRSFLTPQALSIDVIKRRSIVH